MAGATIVFCDLVGFSQLSNDAQKDLIYSLNAEVTHEIYTHLSESGSAQQAIGLPTGDGMAIAFLDQTCSWAPTLFSMINRLMCWAKNNNEIRIGVHVGPVSVISDINRRPNVCGATINVAQRVMDAAHPNQVLFSDAAYQHYVGSRPGYYSKGPFEASRAEFRGPYNIVAKHDLAIAVHIMYRDGDSKWTVNRPYPLGPIFGKILRTQFIGDRLQELLEQIIHTSLAGGVTSADRDEPKLEILEESRFSSFGISLNREVWRTHPDFSEEFYKTSQRQLFLELAKNERTTLKLIIHPPKKEKYDEVRMRARLDALLDWMYDTEVSSSKRIDFVLVPDEGPNRLIVSSQVSDEGQNQPIISRPFCLEGFKENHNATGFALSILHTDKPRIAEAKNSFERIFALAKAGGSTKESVTKHLEDLRKRS